MESNDSTKNSVAATTESNDQVLSTLNNVNNTTENAEIQEYSLKIYNLNDFMHLETPESQIILDPILQTGNLMMIYAKRGIGKSLFAMSLAYAVATGRNFLRWKSYNPAKVMYIDGEMPVNTLQNRFAKIAKGYNDDLEAYTKNIVMISADLQSTPSLNITDVAFQEFVEKNLSDVKLIILDNLSTLTRVDELDNKAWVNIQDWLLKLRKLGIAVIIIHHSGKNGEQRGISRREDVLDCVMKITAKKKTSSTKDVKEDESDFEKLTNGTKCLLDFEKQRNLDAKYTPNIHIVLQDTDNNGIYWIDTDEDIMELHENGLTYRKIAEKTGISKSAVGKIVKSTKS